MKRIFTLSVLLVVTGLLLPACGTHMTIAKRQHSRGYYVDISSDRKSGGKDADNKELRGVEEQDLAKTKTSVDPTKPKHVVKHAEAVEATESTVEAETPVVAETPAPAVERTTTAEKTRRAVSVEKNALQEEHSVSKSLKSTVKQEAKQFNQKQMKKMQSHRATDGLSLFWIVILILLILWALGLIGGLGWFVHIALVVALILLILWLLGVV